MIAYRSGLPRIADVVVVGGGIVGTATAFYASKAGLRAVVLERRPRLASLTTAAATGAFRMQLTDPAELPIVRHSIDLFASFEDQTRQSVYRPNFEQRGYLWVTARADSRQRQRKLVESQTVWGIDGVELLSGDEARYRFPYLPREVLQARFRAGDGFVDPKSIAHGLALGSKASIIVDAEVIGFGLSHGSVDTVLTSRGKIQTKHVVVAAGPFSGEVTHLAGVHLPVKLIRRQRLFVPGLAMVPVRAPMTLDDDTLAHWRPAFGGAFVLYPEPDAEPEAPVEAVATDPQFAFRLLDPSSPSTVATTATFWPQIWRNGSAPWSIQAGQYTMSPDHRPLLGQTSVEGLWVNTGYSGHGVMAGPGGSALLVDELIGKAVIPPEFRAGRAFEARNPASFS